MKSFIPWVGGKSKLLWLIRKLSPSRYSRFIDVFGGSGTVTLSRPIQPGCMEVYNDFNSDLTNLFCCVKNRTMALLQELGFLPLNTRDDFNVLYKFFSKEEFTDDYLDEEMEPAEKAAATTTLLRLAHSLMEDMLADWEAQEDDGDMCDGCHGCDEDMLPIPAEAFADAGILYDNLCVFSVDGAVLVVSDDHKTTWSDALTKAILESGKAND